MINQTIDQFLIEFPLNVVEHLVYTKKKRTSRFFLVSQF